MELSLFEINAILRAASELGAIIALVDSGQLKPYLKKAEAHRLYGRKNIEKWIDDGLITPRKDGGHSASWRIDRIEVELIVQANSLALIL